MEWNEGRVQLILFRNKNTQKSGKSFVKSLFRRDFWPIYALYQTAEYLNDKV